MGSFRKGSAFSSNRLVPAGPVTCHCSAALMAFGAPARARPRPAKTAPGGTGGNCPRAITNSSLPSYAAQAWLACWNGSRATSHPAGRALERGLPRNFSSWMPATATVSGPSQAAILLSPSDRDFEEQPDCAIVAAMQAPVSSRLRVRLNSAAIACCCPLPRSGAGSNRGQPAIVTPGCEWRLK